MSGKTRREFFKTLGAVGAGAILAGGLSGTAGATPPQVPRKPFGKTGRVVSALSLGGMFDILSNQLQLTQALRLGVDYWDTANSYNNGRSEEGMGKYFETHPEVREKVFLVTKSTERTRDGLMKHLDLSLERLKTSYIDLFFIHSIKSIGEMTDEIKMFGEEVKKAGKIKFFGYSTHANMAEILAATPKLGYVDGIMFTYNFRVMQEKDMDEAVARCHAAGIGLTAMKTMAKGPLGFDWRGEMGLGEKFLQKGYTPEQAKLKAVWTDERIASLCSQMPTLNILLANAAAAMDRETLSPRDLAWLKNYALATRECYCAGCSGVCQTALNHEVPVAEVMRSLMYGREYGERDLARETLALALPGGAARLRDVDYTRAAAACPQGLDIARLMHEASVELA